MIYTSTAHTYYTIIIIISPCMRIKCNTFYMTYYNILIKYAHCVCLDFHFYNIDDHGGVFILYKQGFVFSYLNI